MVILYHLHNHCQATYPQEYNIKFAIKKGRALPVLSELHIDIHPCTFNLTTLLGWGFLLN